MNKTIYALGFFDGVHVGHAALLDRCKTLAREENYRAGVVTFAAHPDTLVLGNTPPLINTPYDREKLLRERFSMEQVVTLPFDEQMHTILGDCLTGQSEKMVQKNRKAESIDEPEKEEIPCLMIKKEALEDFCRANGLVSAVVNDQMIDGIRVSSTYIRRQIETGDMETAVKFLGHPHILSGSVVHGHQLGRRLGIPTANLRLPEGLAEPKFGVYACRAVVEGKRYCAVTNIGVRPTVEGRSVTVEPWILDYDGDLYGREITLEFYRFLRPERKFPSLDDLKAEIHRNAGETRAYFGE